MQIGLKASSTSRSNILFMTEMEEKLILKDFLPSCWSIQQHEINIGLNEEVTRYMKSYLSAAGLSSADKDMEIYDNFNL